MYLDFLYKDISGLKAYILLLEDIKTVEINY